MAPATRGRLVLGGAGALALALAAALAAPSCGGGGPRCGDGHHDEGEQCDDGNDDDDDECSNDCIAKVHTEFTVKWEFNKNAAPGFTGDSCIDMGVATVEVRIYNASADQTLTDSCSMRQVVFPDLPAGTYGVTVRPLDVGGELLTTAPVETSAPLAAGSQLEVIVPPEAWKNAYTGTFFFRSQWGGADCGAAAPPVTQVMMTLAQDGVPVAAVTTDGDALDGSAEGPCRPFGSEFPQSAIDLPFGPATFTLVGRAVSGGEATFEETFDTFVGAGIANPELHFDVDSTAPDAGVPDAAVYDATVYDATVYDAP